MATRTTTEARRGSTRAEHALATQRRQAPARIANTSRNARAEIDRHSRWAPARDALWQLLKPLLSPGVQVAILGAGNCDDVPLGRMAERVREVSLIDLDAHAARGARRLQPRRLRRRIRTIGHDVTNGAADAIAIAAANAEVPSAPVIPESPLPGAPYDLVIGDLIYSQLLYPAFVDLDIPAARSGALLARYSPLLTRSVVGRLHISAPNGVVLHIHDPLAWWRGHEQPITLSQILAIARLHPEAAARLAARGSGPHHSDPRGALAAFAIPIRSTTVWRWPFAQDVDYLACATLTGRSHETSV
ncbi:MAG: hypothetical protein M3065_20365 [Actinomycetota bacterium]|nr:hypothetical protein [Actinomycetota bacterium]